MAGDSWQRLVAVEASGRKTQGELGRGNRKRTSVHGEHRSREEGGGSSDWCEPGGSRRPGSMARCRLRRGARQLQPWSRLGSKGSDDASGHGAGEERRMERSLQCSSESSRQQSSHGDGGARGVCMLLIPWPRVNCTEVPQFGHHMQIGTTIANFCMSVPRLLQGFSNKAKTRIYTY